MKKCGYNVASFRENFPVESLNVLFHSDSGLATRGAEAHYIIDDVERAGMLI